MKAFLTIWKSPNKTETDIIDCHDLIVRDGPTIDLDGEECRLFHVIAADGIYHSVACIEVI